MYSIGNTVDNIYNNYEACLEKSSHCQYNKNDLQLDTFQTALICTVTRLTVVITL